ncbi:MAG TPA: ABC transporter substrate-binding protein [Burkholderiaceae bacterium]
MNEGDAARVQAPGVQMEIIMGNAVWRGVLACALAAGLCAATPAAELVIGQVTSLSGPGGAELGQGLRDGAACAFDEVNREGGVNGNRLRLVTLDDRYTPALTVQKTRELLASERPVVLTAFRGTANTLALVKSGLLDESGVALVGSLTGAAELQGVPGIFHTRPSYASEIGKLVDGLLNIQQTRIGVVYENDSFGANGLAAVETALRTRNLKPVGAVAYDKQADRYVASVRKAALALRDSHPQAIIMVAVGQPFTEFVRSMRQVAPSVQLYGISVVDPNILVRELGSMATAIGFSQVFPYPYSDATQLSREYRHALKTCTVAHATPSYPSLEGYVDGRVTIEAIRRAGATPTRRSIRAELERMGELRIGDFTLSYAPGREASSFIDMTIIDQDGFLRH